MDSPDAKTEGSSVQERKAQIADQLVSALARRKCKPCEGGTAPLSPEQAGGLMRDLQGWQLDGAELVKTVKFRNYYETMAFVNAVAWIAHREDHHPNLEVGYNKCRLRYSTHAIGGLSENDFICAAKVDELLREGGHS